MILTLAVLIILIFTTAAHAATRPLPERIARTITATWTCQEAIGQKRTRAGNVWAKHSVAYRQWQLRLWTGRLAACRHQQETHQDIIVQLDSGLRGTPMGGTGKDLFLAARKFRISPFFIAAIAGTESSFGAASCSGNPYNAFGLASCGSSWRVPYFPTWKSAYLFMGEFLTSRWPSATTTMHYYGYAACSSCWGAKTAMHMQQRFGVDNGVRFF
jgi:hypothetical protein